MQADSILDLVFFFFFFFLLYIDHRFHWQLIIIIIIIIIIINTNGNWQSTIPVIYIYTPEIQKQLEYIGSRYITGEKGGGIYIYIYIHLYLSTPKHVAPQVRQDIRVGR